MSERYTIEKYPHTVWVHRGGNASLHDEEIPNELNRLSAEVATLRAVIQETLDHVEDMNIERYGTNQCTLCATYRKKLRAALSTSGETP